MVVSAHILWYMMPRTNPVSRDSVELARLRRAVPGMDLLISKDQKTVGIVVRLRDECRFDPEMGTFLAELRGTLVKILPRKTEFRIVGPPVIREAFLQYNLRSALVFGALGLLVATIATAYIFRSLRVTMMTLIVANVCLVWLLGIMGLFDVRINTASSLSFRDHPHHKHRYDDPYRDPL
jgi:hypothetical protein